MASQLGKEPSSVQYLSKYFTCSRNTWLKKVSRITHLEMRQCLKLRLNTVLNWDRFPMNMGSSSFLNQSPSFQRSHHSPICQPMKNIYIYIFHEICSNNCQYFLWTWWVLFVRLVWFGSYLYGFSKTVFCVKLFKGKKWEAIRWINYKTCKFLEIELKVLPMLLILNSSICL